MVQSDESRLICSLSNCDGDLCTSLVLSSVKPDCYLANFIFWARGGGAPVFLGFLVEFSALNILPGLVPFVHPFFEGIIFSRVVS